MRCLAKEECFSYSFMKFSFLNSIYQCRSAYIFGAIKTHSMCKETLNERKIYRLSDFSISYLESDCFRILIFGIDMLSSRIYTFSLNALCIVKKKWWIFHFPRAILNNNDKNGLYNGLQERNMKVLLLQMKNKVISVSLKNDRDWGVVNLGHLIFLRVHIWNKIIHSLCVCECVLWCISLIFVRSSLFSSWITDLIS